MDWIFIIDQYFQLPKNERGKNGKLQRNDDFSVMKSKKKQKPSSTMLETTKGESKRQKTINQPKIYRVFAETNEFDSHRHQSLFFLHYKLREVKEKKV